MVDLKKRNLLSGAFMGIGAAAFITDAQVMASTQTSSGDLINVIDYFSTYGNWTEAIQTALDDAASSQKEVFIPSGSYPITQQLKAKSRIFGEGIGNTNLLFSNLQGQSALLFKITDNKQSVMGASDLSMITQEQSSSTAIETQAHSQIYFDRGTKYIFNNLAFMDEEGPIEDQKRRCKNAWQTCLKVADCQGLDISNIYCYGNYDPASDDNGTTALYIKANGAQIWVRISAIYTNCYAYGIHFAGKCFYSLSDVDIVRSFIGITNQDAYQENLVFSEGMINNVAINAQKYGLIIQGKTRLFLSNSFVNRAVDGASNSYTGRWIGYYLNEVDKSMISNVTAQALQGTAVSGSYGIILESCNNVSVNGFVAGLNLDTAAVLQDCKSTFLQANLQNHNTPSPVGILMKGSTQYSSIFTAQHQSFAGELAVFYDGTKYSHNSVNGLIYRNSHPRASADAKVDLSTGQMYIID